MKIALDKRAKELRATLKGKELKEALKRLDDTLWIPRHILKDAGYEIPTYGEDNG